MIDQLALTWTQKYGVLDWGQVKNLEPISFDKFESWINKNHHGVLSYMADHRMEARKNLKNIYPNTKAALVFIFDYHKTKKKYVNTAQKISSYVLGFNDRDYHYELGHRLDQMGLELKNQFGINYEIALDTKPVLERDFAYQAGLGWFGKNSMILNQKSGSYFLIGTLLLDKALDIPIKELETDHCGNCRACIDACPTNAILEDERTLIADRCISTFTIELFKDAPAPSGYENTDYIYGCDICQDVCPWSKKSLKEIEEAKDESELLKKINQKELKPWLESLSNREYRKIFSKTPLERTGRVGLLKNLIRK